MTAEFASTDDVRTSLGKLGNRLPTSIDVAAFLSAAHAELVERLAEIYPSGLPDFAGDGLQSVRWAEAKLASAEILDVLAELVGDGGKTSAAQRASVAETLAGGIVGYPPGAGQQVGGRGAMTGPRVSSSTSVSAFPDPYRDVRAYCAED